MFRVDFEHLWFVMHHSDGPNRTAWALTCYFDDSGTEEQSSAAVIGGPVLDRAHFLRFDSEWRALLDLYRIEWPLHMRDFVRPHGRYIGRRFELKHSFFQKVARTINEAKLYSLSIVVPQADYKTFIPIDVYREFMAPYTMAFLVAGFANHRVATKSRVTAGDAEIAYLVDHGY